MAKLRQPVATRAPFSKTTAAAIPAAPVAEPASSLSAHVTEPAPTPPPAPARPPLVKRGYASAKPTNSPSLSKNRPVAVPPPLHALATPQRHDPKRLILLGASTGGTEALREVLMHLPSDLPGIAIVQHIPAHFSRAFADRLNACCALEVREAVDGDKLVPGLALIAPGNYHMMLQWIGGGYRVRVSDGPLVWHQRPAVDILFKSAVEIAGPHAIGGILTGMGKDGAEGLLRLRDKGAITFAQDEETSVVYGMPKVAWEMGGAQRQLPIDQVAEFIVQAANTAPVVHARPAHADA